MSQRSAKRKLQTLLTHSAWLGIIEEGEPLQWNESRGEYDIDRRKHPEHWAFKTADPADIVRVYSDGQIETYDNSPLSLEELEQLAVNVLSALAKAYQVKAEQS